MKHGTGPTRILSGHRVHACSGDSKCEDDDKSRRDIQPGTTRPHVLCTSLGVEPSISRHQMASMTTWLVSIEPSFEPAPPYDTEWRGSYTRTVLFADLDPQQSTYRRTFCGRQMTGTVARFLAAAAAIKWTNEYQKCFFAELSVNLRVDRITTAHGSLHNIGQ